MAVFAGLYTGVAEGVAGAPLPAASITIKNVGTQVNASIFTDRTKAVAATNPVVADSLGNFTVYAAPGLYDLVCNGKTVTVEIGSDAAEPVPGSKLGSAISTVPFTLPTTLSAYLGLSVPVTMFAGMELHVELSLPTILMGATATTVAAEIIRDGSTQIAASIISVVANGFGNIFLEIDDVPVAGAHIYSVSVQLGVASVGALSEAGSSLFGLYAVYPSLRVAVC